MGHDSLLDSTELINLSTSTELKNWDAICVIDKKAVSRFSTSYSQHDDEFDKELSCQWSPEFNSLVVYSPIGDLTDYDDVRCYAKAARKAVDRAIKAGKTSKVAIVIPESEKYSDAPLQTLLGALTALYVPIELREEQPTKKKRLNTLGVFMENSNKLKVILERAQLFNSGIFIARDIGMGDPERMAAPRVEEYVGNIFKNYIHIKMTVVSDISELRKEYPLFQAVNRAACTVPRHSGRIIFLEYRAPKPIKTVMLVGKGVTYDTGGADIKAGGIMAGMSRDKCGAASVAGFMKVVAETSPNDVNVFAALCMVRNSIGEECYVSDEIITSRGGARVRIGNTDAEGRMAMADSLAKFKEIVVKENLPDPHLFTIATLTGHACLAVGEGYTICIDNAPARAVSHAYKLKEAGELVGDLVEISTLRQEDFEFHSGTAFGDDLLQCNDVPSSRTPRGSITPAAFLIVASGLDKHGLKDPKPIKYSHLDVAASVGYFPHISMGVPILALAKEHLKI